MTRRYTLEVLAEDEGLIDQPGDASFTMTSRIGDNDLEVSVFETLVRRSPQNGDAYSTITAGRMSSECLRQTTSSPRRAREAQRGGERRR